MGSEHTHTAHLGVLLGLDAKGTGQGHMQNLSKRN